jgi:hypothetical protein
MRMFQRTLTWRPEFIEVGGLDEFRGHVAQV